MLHLTQRGVEVFIGRYSKKDQESYWDNYDLLIWKQDHSGFTNIKGLFRKNAWGLADRVSVDSNGIWKLPKKYVKYFK
jgi:hypothetical protein